MMSANVDRTNDPVADLAAARALHRRLRALGRAAAPGSLLGAVLEELGLSERYLSLPSPIGTVYVAFDGQRIRGVAPAADDASFERAYRARTGRVARRAEPIPTELVEAIERHLAGQPDGQPDGQPVGLELDLGGVSEFERAVLLKAREIPRGEVRPYGWIAREIGRPGAVRAVGSALNKNPIPLLIPCHRVVRSDGTVGQYAFGPSMKRALLAAEGLDLAQLAALAQARVRFVGNDATGTFCWPTCQRVRGLPPGALRRLPTAAAARAAGYRACPSCRPAAEAV
jgi:O-6-methylguanine DNA methyltransferase